MGAICVIPARVESKRLPGKVLLSETGKPLVQHAVENALACEAFDRVILATDSLSLASDVTSDLIASGVARPGAGQLGSRIVQSREFANGTERVAEAIVDYMSRGFPEPDLVVGLQADEPEVTAEHLSQLVTAHRYYRDFPAATLFSNRRPTIEQKFDRNVVMASLSPIDIAVRLGAAQRDGLIPNGLNAAEMRWSGDRCKARSIRACWASSFIRGCPGDLSMDAGDDVQAVHVGVYSWALPALRAYAAVEPSYHERHLDLEQMRCDWPFLAVPVDHAGSGINTRADYDAFVARHRAREGVA